MNDTNRFYFTGQMKLSGHLIDFLMVHKLESRTLNKSNERSLNGRVSLTGSRILGLFQNVQSTLFILDMVGTTLVLASDFPVTLSSRSAACLQNRTCSAALSSSIGSRMRTENKNIAKEEHRFFFITIIEAPIRTIRF